MHQEDSVKSLLTTSSLHVCAKGQVLHEDGRWILPQAKMDTLILMPFSWRMGEGGAEGIVGDLLI